MKALITSPSLDVSDNVSGIASHTKLLIEHCDHLVHFVIGRKDGERRDHRWVAKQILVFKRFSSAINAVDCVHFNLPLERFSILSGVMFALLVRWHRVPLLVHIRGGAYSNGRPIPRFIGCFLRVIFWLSDQVILLSESEAEIMRARFPIKTIHVISNKVVVPAGLRSDKYHSTILQLVYAGRIVQDKGINELIRALRQLETQIEIKCVVAGSGAPDLIQQLNDLNCVDYRGLCTPEELRSIYDNSAIFLLPSYYEGMPNAMLEAMAFGCVPVVTNVGAIASVVSQDNGKIVKIQDWEAVAESVLELAAEPSLLEKLGIQAHNDIKRDYNIASYVQDLRRIHRSLIDA